MALSAPGISLTGIGGGGSKEVDGCGVAISAACGVDIVVTQLASGVRVCILSQVAVETVGRLQHFGDKVGALEILINELLDATIDVAVEVGSVRAAFCSNHGKQRTCYARYPPYTGGELGSVDPEVRALESLDPVDTEALLVPDVNFARATEVSRCSGP